MTSRAGKNVQNNHTGHNQRQTDHRRKIEVLLEHDDPDYRDQSDTCAGPDGIGYAHRDGFHHQPQKYNGDTVSDQ